MDPLVGHVIELEGNVKPQTIIDTKLSIWYTVKLDYNEKLDEFGLGRKINIKYWNICLLQPIVRYNSVRYNLVPLFIFE